MTIIQRTVVVLIGTQLAASAVILFIFDLNSYNHFSDSFSWHHFLNKLIGGFSFYLFSAGLFLLLIGMCAPRRKKKRISVHEKENSLK
ncbi:MULTISPECIES: hypothetical protein [Bacillus]|jgi:multisubunit Na+/H+ antiporter MnhC subunit|uniref:YuzI n=1 Tax=Bacillus mojavensis TaxID=72360 RepID=A0AAP3FX79_BACMO|nr:MULTISPECIES: hypothetical protein [Bacillus]MCC2930516.1 hypothetical protein [Bacillus sp. LBG-1-113]MCL6427056.1 hypothetical protein [Bacillus subtilis]MCY8104881.1 hypothetical protein [Bacillus mojavensis]MCY8483416.1 hypothetical protein [Bacillus mojavensis]MCY8511511.1 hypothetical protein [Bacillus mojavensis]